MKKLILLSLIVIMIAALTPALVLAAGYDEPVSGQSPHAGWTTTSDQCKQCHAVHKAIGNRFLLRSSDSRYNDCAYCHLDGAGAAGYDVYTNSLLNGHTTGAIGLPGLTSPLTKNTTGATGQLIRARTSRFTSDGRVIIPDHGNTASDSEAVKSARSYRGGGLAKNNSAAWVGYNATQTVAKAAVAGTGGGTGLRDSGDTTFNCNSCHMAHANPEKIISWRFLSLNPNARTRNETGLYTYYGPEWPAYSGPATIDARTVNTTSLTNKILVRKPDDYTPTTNLPYVYSDSTARTSGQRRSAVTQWCAACHNLNVMGSGIKDNGTYYDSPLAWDGDGNKYRWYSHTTYWNLGVDNRGSSNYEIVQKSAPLGDPEYDASKYAGGNYPSTAAAPACYDCHVGYGNTNVRKDNPDPPGSGVTPDPYSSFKGDAVNSPDNTYDPFVGVLAVPAGQNYDDWPHTGSTQSYALLKTIPTRMTAGDATDPDGGATINNLGTDASTYNAAGLDNVCRQCHAVVNRDPGTVLFDNRESGTFDGTWPNMGPGGSTVGP